MIIGWHRCCLGWSMWYSWTQEELFLWDWVDRAQHFTVPKLSKSMFVYAVALFSPPCANVSSPWILFAFGILLLKLLLLDLSQRK